jgi:anaerobic selenocysteine-containing dehydrogenase
VQGLFFTDAALRAAGKLGVIDTEFIAQHTEGFEDFADWVRATPWEDIENESGLRRGELEAAALVFAQARSVIAVYGMGLTQHRKGVHNVQMLVNLLLLGGHIGRPGAGICPVRGHSNVQGQRTVGITEKPELAPLDKLAELYSFEPPRKKGKHGGDLRGRARRQVKAFIGLGGNFVRAVPDTDRIMPAWRRLRLTVHVATKLNRTPPAAGPGGLPAALPGPHRDRPPGGRRADRVDGGFDRRVACLARRGRAGGGHAASEVAIVARLAEATLAPNPKLPGRAGWPTTA